MKLYLGCAEPPFHQQHYEFFPDLDSFTWVDKYVKHPNIKNWDAQALPIAENSCEVIYASHLLEHLPHVEAEQILLHWLHKLRSNGKLFINVPDLEWVCRQLIKLEQGFLLDGYYNTYNGSHGLMSIFYGSQSHEGEYHKSAFTKNSLITLLAKIGLRDVEVRKEFDAHDMGVLLAEGVK